MQPQSADSNPYPALLVTKNPRPDDPPSKKPNNIVVYPFKSAVICMEKAIEELKESYPKYLKE